MSKMAIFCKYLHSYSLEMNLATCFYRVRTTKTLMCAYGMHNSWMELLVRLLHVRSRFDPRTCLANALAFTTHQPSETHISTPSTPHIHFPSSKRSEQTTKRKAQPTCADYHRSKRGRFFGVLVSLADPFLPFHTHFLSLSYFPSTN